MTFAENSGLSVHGYTLLLHLDLPQWMIDYQGTSAEWLAMMETHIETVATHYTGKVVSWDVLNEAIDDDLNFRSTIWYNNIGEDYIGAAFDAAHRAAPDADLYYNDYNLSGVPEKMDAVLEMVDQQITGGTPIHGIGLQMHINIYWPDNCTIQSALQKIVDRNLKVRISELDIALSLIHI